jgi:hypothetical protein
MSTRRIGKAGVALAALAIAGCAVSTRIESQPSGANVSIDGKPIGVTPATLTVPRSEWPRAYVCRVDKEGFETETRTLEPTLGGGRVAGAIFTVGLSLLFASPYVFSEDTYEFALSYDDTTASRAPEVAPRTTR